MHINLEQKKIYYDIDIHKDKLFESQRFVYKRIHCYGNRHSINLKKKKRGGYFYEENINREQSKTKTNLNITKIS